MCRRRGEHRAARGSLAPQEIVLYRVRIVSCTLTCRIRHTWSRLAVSTNSACFAMLHSGRRRTTRMLKRTFTGFLPFRVLSQKPGVHSMRQALLAGLSVVGLLAITAPTASAATDYR